MLRSYTRCKLDRNGTDINDAARSSHDDTIIGSRSESEDDEFEDDLNMLREFSLVTITTQSGLLEMHPLMQFCSQFWVSTFDNLRKWRRRFLQVISKEYPGRRDSETGQDAEDLTRLLADVGVFRSRMWKYGEAEQMTRRAVRRYGETLGGKCTLSRSRATLFLPSYYKQAKYEDHKLCYNSANSAVVSATLPFLKTRSALSQVSQNVDAVIRRVIEVALERVPVLRNRRGRAQDERLLMMHRNREMLAWKMY
ncbi:hypothetical protein CDEST_06285 [Colletotrichum destructivum]|uniref:Uncharacterized protein n=1 Tax=Colletotrichum destructivum TaxID=34406 RepID=A0AAX4IDQ3_9PEZI|nr:hypothetical protein CDEST_06285 [Colletotrichum destructivum]